MRRRQVLSGLLGSALFAGCTGGPGDPITMLAVNQDDVPHTVAVRVVRGKSLAVANTVEVASSGTAELGRIPWKSGRYRVTVQVDDEVVLVGGFRSTDWFNQLDVFIASDGSVELHRGRAA
ncbi:MAG: hypothetical protein ABEJ73_01420 [Haloplanus sp.]